MDLAGQMILFAKVVESGGFSATARELGLTPSAVSRQIGHLEDRLGMRLLNRSTRRVSLTDVGGEFYGRCADIAQEVADAEALVLAFADHPRGTLHVAATSAFAKAQVIPLLPAFLDANPELTLSLELTDRHLDLVEDRIDLAIRFSEQVADENAVARKLAPNRRVFCAAPSYVAEHGQPSSPEELNDYNCLRLSTVEAFNHWEIANGNGARKASITGNFDTNSTDGLFQATLAGLGIAKLSTYLVNDAIRDGRLVRILPDYVEDKSEMLAIFPNKRNLSPNVRAFIDFLTGHFGPVPPWERNGVSAEAASRN